METVEWRHISADFLFYARHFCNEHEIEVEPFCSVMRELLEFSFAEKRTREESYAYFKAKMIDKNEYSLDQIKLLADFVSTTFFRHFNAYAYCRQHPQQVDVYEKKLVVETPMSLPPLKYFSS